MNLDAYTKQLKEIVQLCQALILILGATEAVVKVLATEDIMDISNTSNTNKWKYQIDKSWLKFQVDINFNGPNNVI